MGPFMARLSVSSLVFDYILTGPISVVSAGQYLGRLLNEISEHAAPEPAASTSNYFRRVLRRRWSPLYFWWQNIKGIHESSGKALRIMQITTVMVVVLLIWCPLTILLHGPGARLRPRRSPRNLHFSADALGWFKGTFWLHIPIVAIIIAFGHSLLSMSGFETLAQVYREIAYPKLKNLKITANIVCWYAVICTGVITVFAGMIIPDEIRTKYSDNLLGGLAMSLAGPDLLRLAFHIFVVIVGVLILAGAVNTSIIGANGVLNRVAEDGVLLDWFRKPHKRFGTTYRIINLIALLQIATIIAQPRRCLPAGRSLRVRRGVELLPEIAGRAGAALPAARSGIQSSRSISTSAASRFPSASALTTLVLGLVAIANLFSKQIATMYGVAFTIGVLHHVHHLRTDQSAQAQDAGAKRRWKNSTWIISRRSITESCTPVPAACWWRCAITTTWSI